MLARLVARWAMPVGSFTALSMAFSLMVKCLLIRLSEVETTLSVPSSVKLDPESRTKSSLW
ncbi:UNVERIFIED_CONTAM: hypothetical protein GTU68_037632 [Idotea baltica]|nr:hypothetical protein [Idotea baltica]